MMEVGKHQSKNGYIHCLPISYHQELTSHEINLGEFPQVFDPTLLVNNMKFVEVDGLKCLIYTQDTQSKEAWPVALLSQWIRDSHGALLVYSITCHASFDHITDYLELVRNVRQKYTPKKPFVVALVGNKCDLGHGPDRQVERDEGEKFARTAELTGDFKEVSAKTGEGVEEIFYDVVKKIRHLEVQSREKEKLATAESSAKSKKGIKEVFYDVARKVHLRK
jgi:GTPase SAR1 family protein